MASHDAVALCGADGQPTRVPPRMNCVSGPAILLPGKHVLTYAYRGSRGRSPSDAPGVGGWEYWSKDSRSITVHLEAGRRYVALGRKIGNNWSLVVLSEKDGGPGPEATR
jgi:hypothetical protein